MAGRKKHPNITFDKQRKLTPQGMDPRGLPDNLTLNEFINQVKSSGNVLYPDKNTPLSDNMGVIHKDAEISASTQVLANLIGVSAKGKMLRDLLDKTQKDLSKNTDLFIPVSGSPETVKAIARVFPKSSPGHDRIYWNMWVDVVRSKIRQGDLISSEMLESLTGDNEADSKIIDDTIKAGEITKSKQIIQRAGQQQFSATSNGGAGPTPLDYGSLRSEAELDTNAEILKELLVYGASLILLYFLNRKLAIWKAPESQQMGVSSALYPSPASIGVMIAQIIIGLAMHYLIEGLLGPDVKSVLDNINIPGVSEDEKANIIIAAQELADGQVITVGPMKGKDINHPDVKSALGFKDGVLEVVKSYFQRGDYDLIFEYGLNWLNANANGLHIKGDFSQWLVLPELESMIYNLDNTIDQAPNYSQDFKNNADKIGIKPSPTIAISDSIDQEHANFIKELTSSSRSKASARLDAIKEDLKHRFDPHEMSDNLLNAIHDQGCASNDSINRLGSFLTHDPFIASTVCCFIRYFGAVDLKLLHAMRSILQIFSRGIVFDLGNFLNTISSNIYDDIFNRARTGLMARVNGMFDSIFKEVLEWTEAEELDLLAECLPIDGFIKFTASSMFELQQSLEIMIDDFIKLADIENFSMDSKISILTEQRWAKSLFQIVDAIIQVAADGNNCRLTGDPTTDQATNTLIQSLLNSDPRQPASLFYNNLVNQTSGSDSELGQTRINNTLSSDNRPTNSIQDLVLTKTARYIPQIVDPKLKALIEEPTEFNSFLDNAGFITQNNIKVNSMVKNLDNEEAFAMDVDSVVNPKNINQCFQSIDQTELLKQVLGKVNG